MLEVSSYFTVRRVLTGYIVAMGKQDEIDAGGGCALNAASIRIVIADDHEIFRRGLRSLLESREDWQVCGEAVDGQEAVDRVRELKPDVVVLDVTMPRMNGLEAAREIRRQVPDSKVVILSQHEPGLMKQSALAAGAGAYVTKSEVSRELMNAIEQVVSSK
jgi:DNA-binding NarL/FixJ family response regulator